MGTRLACQRRAAQARGHPTTVLSTALAACMMTGCALETYTPAALDQAAVPRTIESAHLLDEAHHALLAGLDAAAAWPPRAWTPQQLGIIAIHRSRAVSAAQAVVAAANAGKVVAAQGPSPGFGLTLEHHSERDHEGGTKWSIGPSFQYLWSPVDRRRIRVALADTMVVTARTAVLDAAWSAWQVAATSALELAAERGRYALLEAQAATLDAAVAVARRQVAAGLAENFEWQALQLEANSTRMAGIERIERIGVAGTMLAAALNLPPAALGSLLIEAEPATATPDFAEVQRRALVAHPAVLSALADYDKAERDLELAVAAQYPDITLNPGYLFDQSDNVWSLLSGVVVPLAGLQHAAIARAAAARDAARERFYAVQAATIAAVQGAWGEYAASVTALAAARTLIAEVEANEQLLARRLADGLIDPLTVARAGIERAALAARVEALAWRQRRAALALEFAARAAIFDDALGRYLATLYTVAGAGGG